MTRDDLEKERVDSLVQRQAQVSRSKAQGLIRTGHVYDGQGNRLDKPGMRLPSAAVLDIRQERRFVSRGGEKLEAAFKAFPCRPAGRIAIDVGASTGGFTDCLLQHGAAKVYAVDVGYGQMAWQIRQDTRVVVMERTNIRRARPEQFAEPPDFFTVDCSFISLRLVIPPLAQILAPEAEGVVLIKPQFEAGKKLVSKGGVVKDPEVRQKTVQEVIKAARVLGFEPCGVIPSPLLGPAGNEEFLAWLRRGLPSGADSNRPSRRE